MQPMLVREYAPAEISPCNALPAAVAWLCAIPIDMCRAAMLLESAFTALHLAVMGRDAAWHVNHHDQHACGVHLPFGLGSQQAMWSSCRHRMPACIWGRTSLHGEPECSDATWMSSSVDSRNEHCKSRRGIKCRAGFPYFAGWQIGNLLLGITSITLGIAMSKLKAVGALLVISGTFLKQIAAELVLDLLL